MVSWQREAGPKSGDNCDDGQKVQQCRSHWTVGRISPIERVRLTEMDLRALLLVIGVAIAGGPAEAQSLKLTGTAGVLSEWQLAGDVTETGPNQFSGPLTWEHVGLCHPNGPVEQSGQINLQISGSEMSSKLQATIRLEGAQCTYKGTLGSTGFMDCSNMKGVPVSISIK